MPFRRLEELTRDLLGEALVAVANCSAADAGDSRHERQRDEEEGDDAGRNADPRLVAGADLGACTRLPDALPVTAGRWAVEQAPAAGVRAIEGRAGEQRRDRQPREQHFPALRPQRAFAVR